MPDHDHVPDLTAEDRERIKEEVLRRIKEPDPPAEEAGDIRIFTLSVPANKDQSISELGQLFELIGVLLQRNDGYQDTKVEEDQLVVGVVRHETNEGTLPWMIESGPLTDQINHIFGRAVAETETEHEGHTHG